KPDRWKRIGDSRQYEPGAAADLKKGRKPRAISAQSPKNQAVSRAKPEMARFHADKIIEIASLESTSALCQRRRISRKTGMQLRSNATGGANGGCRGVSLAASHAPFHGTPPGGAWALEKTTYLYVMNRKPATTNTATAWTNWCG